VTCLHCLVHTRDACAIDGMLICRLYCRVLDVIGGAGASSSGAASTVQVRGMKPSQVKSHQEVIALIGIHISLFKRCDSSSRTAGIDNVDWPDS